MRFAERTVFEKNTPLIKIFRSKVSPFKRAFSEHHHTQCELSLCLSGSGIYRVKNREYSFNSGDMFLFGSDEVHCLTEINTDLDLLNIQFEPRILWDNEESIELLKLFTSRNKNFSNRFSQTDQKLTGIISEIERESREKNIGYITNCKYGIFSALIHILREYNFVSETPFVCGSLVTESLKNGIEYIDLHLDGPLTLKEIASCACMTETYFSTVFKKFSGISPWEYITIKRVEKAVELIKTTSLTKLEIAQKCGFSSSSNFYKAFTKITGKQPKNYEQKNQQS